MEIFYEDIKGKSVIITGGNKGIGKGCAQVFCQAGANVVICGRDQEAGDTVAAELVAAGYVCLFVKCDVSIEKDIINLVDTTVSNSAE